MTFGEGPNWPKKPILSMQRHRRNVKTLHSLEAGKIMVSESLGGALALSPGCQTFT